MSEAAESANGGDVKGAEASWTFSWRQLFLDFLSVLLGVLAAFGVSEWREAKSQRSLGALALTNINREILANRDHLLQVKASNEGFFAREAADTREIRTYALGWGLQSTAWEVAQSTGAINFIDYEIALSLSGLYQFQQTYSDLIHGLAQAQMVAILSAEGDDPAATERNIDRNGKVYLDIMATNEQQLLERYQQALRYAGLAEQSPEQDPSPE